MNYIFNLCLNFYSDKFHHCDLQINLYVICRYMSRQSIRCKLQIVYTNTRLSLLFSYRIVLLSKTTQFDYYNI